MKTWFITGANGGLAYPMLEILLARGDRVAATTRKPQSLDELRKKYGSSLWQANLDLTDSPAIKRKDIKAVLTSRLAELEAQKELAYSTDAYDIANNR
ncbi:MAG: hypothetical protein LBF86_00360 [Helicobacteraceae bacterium]|jgi:NADP-dependent 3-hydroxy acid dehydrogenase YdfG|nr:hypothetical protein [Helicobacteraceae bacterium]